MEFKDYKYERINLDEVKDKYGALLDELSKASSPETFKDVFDKINVYRGHILTMYTLVTVRHSIDNSDKFYDEENEYWSNTMPLIQVYENKLFRLLNDCTFKDKLNIPHTLFKMAEFSIKAFNEDIISDLQEENKTANEYDKLKASAKIEFNGEIHNLASISPLMNSDDRDVRKNATKAYIKWFEDNEEAIDDIFDRLVHIRDNMAKKLGYKNYVELGYLRMNRFDYDEKMVKNYRNQVIQEIVPIATKINNLQAKRIGVDKLECYDVKYEFKDGNPKPIGDTKTKVDAALKMYSSMSNKTKEYFETMVDNQLFDLETKPNKQMGGYCTPVFDYRVPFIFSNFNGTSGDVNVLTHEAGHGLQAYISMKNIDVPDLAFPTYETCEIHSMSMEFFAFPYLSNFFNDKDVKKYKYEELAGALTFLPYGCLVDHFQHEIYKNPNMTKEERKATWRKLEKIYKPDTSYEGFDLLERGGYFYRQSHIFDSPFYYIDYTLAQVCALQFFNRVLNNDKEAFNDYLKICEVGGTLTFTEVVKLANLKVPFEDGCLSSISKSMEDELDKLAKDLDC